MPIDLGSGTGDYKGGGAINLVASDTLLNNGDISSSGGSYRTSGGSIYVTTNKLTGTGTFNANGGDTFWPYRFAGGGGRIAVYYQQSTFTGNSKANAGIYCFYGCNPAGGEGTVAFFDTANNDLYPKGFFRFQANDAPFNFHDVVVANGTSVEIEKGVNINANSISTKDLSGVTTKDAASLNVRYFGIDRNSFLDILGAPTLNISTIDIGKGSTLTMSGDETLTAGTININNGGILTIAKEHTLSLTVSNLNISADSFISANAKGYGAGVGQGVPATYYAGASYGGVGLWNSSTSTYGSAEEPVDFGSGGNGHLAQGGGAIRIIVTDTLSNNGTIYANGSRTSSGGSIYITANNISGSGTYRANGGALYCSSVCYGVGGGGRVALYYVTSSFTGGVFAKGGCSRYDGWSFTCGGDGTAIMKKMESVCQADCYSNVLFLPGMMGSRLFEQSSVCEILNNEKERWTSTSDCDHKRLALDSTGKSIYPLYTKEGKEGAVDDTYSFNIYQSFMNDLDNWKNDEHIIADYGIVPYDWRLSLDDIVSGGKVTSNGLSYIQATSSPYIIQELRNLAANSRTGKVTIVAHSNGGLVAKALIQKLKDEHDPLYDKIDNVVFVAVPQAGTPEAVGKILHGGSIGGFVMSAKRVRDLLNNMPSAYNLTPSRAYIGSSTPLIEFDGSAVSPELIARYGNTIDTYDELKDYLVGGDGRAVPAYDDLDSAARGNSTLLSSADGVHAILDQWTPATSTMVYEIAGWGIYTPAGLRYEKNKKCIPADFPSTPQTVGTPQPIACEGYVDTFKLQDKFTLNGDDTVVGASAHLISASTMTQKWWVDLGEYNKPRTTIDRDHKDIFEVEPLRLFIKSIITHNISPQSNITDNSATLVLNADYIKYELHSPLDLDIYDQTGNHTGIATSTGLIEEGIKGSSYFTLGDTKIVIVPAETLHTVKLNAYASGSFTFDLEELRGDTVVASTTYEAVPTATSTQATLVWTGTLSASTTLAVDFNGDSTMDITLKPTLGGTSVYDIAPPEVQFSFDTETNKFNIIGTDNLSAVSITTTATSTTAIDEAGNTTVVPFLEYEREPTKAKIVFNTIIYNGAATTTPKTTLEYEWKFKNPGILKSFDQEIKIKDVRKIEAKYRRGQNETKIVDEFGGDGKNQKAKVLKSGIAVVKVITESGKLLVDY